MSKIYQHENTFVIPNETHSCAKYFQIITYF